MPGRKAEEHEMKCSRCGCALVEGEAHTLNGETLCDDCYLDASSPVRVCDPWAVYTATHSRELSGLKGTEGLTELQRAIYGFVRERGKATREEIMARFNIAPGELETQFAVLRHCELLKGHKEGDRVYVVPFA